MNYEAELHKQLLTIDPHYTLSPIGRAWRVTLTAYGHDIVVENPSKLAAMDAAIGRAKQVTKPLEEGKE